MVGVDCGLHAWVDGFNRREDRNVRLLDREYMRQIDRRILDSFA